MAEFRHAINTVLQHEGKFVDDYRDPGAATNFGISLRFLEDYAAISRQNFDVADIDDDGDIDKEDIKKLTVTEAQQFYHANFWYPNNFISITHQPLATKLLDLSVNMGAKQAIVCFQRCVRSVSGQKLLEDGIFGPKTLKAANTQEPFELMCALKSEAAGFYRLLAVQRSSLKPFLVGWLNRCYSGPL